MLCSPVRQGHRLGSAAGQACGMGSKDSQGLCSSSLVMLAQMLYLTVGDGSWLGSLLGYRMGFRAARFLCPGFLVGQD